LAQLIDDVYQRRAVCAQSRQSERQHMPRRGQDRERSMKERPALEVERFLFRCAEQFFDKIFR
jgi:hypothetical protein